jgi:hypothetical protein
MTHFPVRRRTGPACWGVLAAHLLAVLWMFGVPVAHAGTVDNDATLVGSKTAPVSREFTIAQAGTYELTLSDVGFPAPLVSVQAAITHGDKLLVVRDMPGTVSFTAEAGTYELQVAGIAANATGLGSFAAKVTSVPAGSTPLDYSDVVETPQAAPAAGQLTLQTQVTLVEAGAHRISLTDIAFPEPLVSIELLLTRGGVEYARLDAANPVADFTGVAGVYDLLVVAQAAATSATGLFGVRVINLGSSAQVFDASYPIGKVTATDSVTLPAAATYTMAVTDLGFPVALGAASATLVRGSELLARVAGGASVSFNATAGVVDLYALPTPAMPSAVGSMSVEVLQGASRIKSGVYVATPDATSGETTLFNDVADVPAAGTVRATLTDFEFPAAFANLQLGVIQNGVQLGRRTGAGTIDLPVESGSLAILVASSPAAAPGSGLYGVQLATATAGTLLYEQTRGSGALFQQRVITIPATGSYDATISDLEFPARFAELAAAVTRGTQKVGFVFGGGKFTFSATPGDYFINFITRVDAAATYGTYGLKVEDTPPPPTVTLTAAAASVAAGESTTLTWSSTNATSCLATGQWSGSKAVASSETVGPISTQSTFTLACTGPGGTVSKSVAVELKSNTGGNGGGGGAFDARVLLLILLLAAWSQHARRRARR